MVNLKSKILNLRGTRNYILYLNQRFKLKGLISFRNQIGEI